VPSRFTEYPQGLAHALAAEPMQQALARKMGLVRIYAEAIAPVRTGRYAGFTETADRPGNPGQGGYVIVSGVRNGKAYARLINITPYAVYLEFGTRYMRRQRPLGRALDALH
jgi:hypothetical protein